MNRFWSVPLVILFVAFVSFSVAGCSSTPSNETSSYDKTKKTTAKDRMPKRAPTSNSGFGGYRY